jgi:predicted ATPase/DNA-binding SARP family transcriptional activator
MPLQHSAITLDDGSRLHIKLLGGLQVNAGGRIIADKDWRLRKTRNLIKLLALAPGHQLHREQLLDLLWPEESPERASHNLHQSLYVARRALVESGGKTSRYLSLNDEVISLAPSERLWIDVDEFEAAAQLARAHKEPTSYRAALKLYGGDLLPEDRYEEWAERRRESLRQTYIGLLIEFAAIHAATRQFDLGIEALQRVIENDPANEEAHRGLMRLYAQSGRRQQALRQYQLLKEALTRDVDASPDPVSEQLHQDIQQGTLPDSAPAHPKRTSEPVLPLPPGARGPSSVIPGDMQRRNNLPNQLASFVGRTQEISEIKRRLGAARLLSLVGAGGCGKTRLAIEVSSQALAAGDFADGVWLVELAALSEPSLVTQAVASVLHVGEHGGQALVETVTQYLQPKCLLLVLDNCEHLIAACAQLAEALLRACPDLRILATSREPLRILGELTWRVNPLILPDPAGTSAPVVLMQSDAVRLFVERASAVSSGFVLTEQNAADVVRICSRLDGIPLAIELAAVRLSAMSLPQIASHLDDAFRLLTTGSRTALPRQQTLRALMDWSYTLLSEPERTMLRQLSVFAGGFTLEAAEQVCGISWDAGSASNLPSTLDLLTQLVNKSLVQCEPAGDGVRYHLLHTVRLYAGDRLLVAREADSTRGRHRLYYLALAEQGELQFLGPKQLEWLGKLEGEYQNLVDALGWSRQGASASGAGAAEHAEMLLRLCGALWVFWYGRSTITEGRQWLSEALGRRSVAGASAQPALIKVLVGAGAFAWLQGDYATATTACLESLELARRLGQASFPLMLALSILGLMAQDQGDMQQADRYHEEGLQLMRSTGNQFGLAFALVIVGNITRIQGKYERADQVLAEGLAIQRAIGDRWGEALTLHNMGQVALELGDSARARETNDASLALFKSMGHTWGMATTTLVAGEIAAAEGDYDRALDALRDALVLYRQLEDTLGIARVLLDMGRVWLAKGDAVQSRRLILESLAERRMPADRAGVILVLGWLAVIAEAGGDRARAARLFGAADTIRQSFNLPAAPLKRVDPRGMMAAARARLQDSSLDGAWAEGRALTLDRAVHYAQGN